MPLFRRRRKTEANDDVAFRKAVEAVAAAVMAADIDRETLLTKADGLLEKAGPYGLFQNTAVNTAPKTSWSNQGNTNWALINRLSQKLAANFSRAPEEVEAALAEAGLSWGPPFPPGRPLDPFYGYRREPRTWDYAIGENIQLVPRWNRISFTTLKSIIDSYYAAQIAVRHLINDVRSLDYQFVPPQNVLEDASDDIEAAERFFRYPDGVNPFRTWLAEYLQDVLRYDAGTLYIRRGYKGQPVALEVVDGTTIIPLVDFWGRTPTDQPTSETATKIRELGGQWDGKTVPAYLQVIEGMPWVWLAKDDIIYQRLNPLPESQYGLAPMEAVLLQANTDIRFQWFFLQYFTEGTIPAGFMEAPPDQSDPAQIREWQKVWDAVMYGDQSKLHQVRWVPAGARFTAIKEQKFDPEFPLYLMRCTAAAFGVVPNDLGFTDDVNRSTGEIQVDVQFRIGTLPIVRHVEDVINAFIAHHLKLKARIQFDTGQGTQHRLEIAQANKILIDTGVISPDEVRMQLGYRVSRERPTPRAVNNSRTGPIPLLALESLAGKVDPTTFGPAKDQPVPPHPFVAAPGVAPVIGSKAARAAENATAALQDNLIIANTSDQAPHAVVQADGTVSTHYVAPEPIDPDDDPGGSGPKPKPKTKTKGARKEVQTGTFGMSYDTNMQGVDLIGDEDEADEAAEEQGNKQFQERLREHMNEVERRDAFDIATKALQDMALWRRVNIKRVKDGRPTKDFPDILPVLHNAIWPRLAKARTVEEVREAFIDPLGRLTKEDDKPSLAGILVQAADTGRVLLIQRLPDKHDDDSARARWELPGGHIDGNGKDGGDPDPTAWDGALREWSEETGAQLPADIEPLGSWYDEDAGYQGFVVRIPHEADLTLRPQPDEVSNVGWWDLEDLTDPEVRDKLQEQLALIDPLLKSEAIPVDDYLDRVIAAMESVLSQSAIRRTIRRAANPVRKQTVTMPNQPSTQTVRRHNAAIMAGGAALGAAPGVAGMSTIPPAMGGLLHSAGMIAGAASILWGSYLNTALLKRTLADIYADAAQAANTDPYEAKEYYENLADQWANEIAQSLLKRVLLVIDRDITEKKSFTDILADVARTIRSKARAVEIIKTEWMRAYNAAKRRQAESTSQDVELVWVHMPGACDRCLENAAASPITPSEDWPNGSPPVHPNCRCSIVVRPVSEDGQ